uniref:Uncharacterized protein n=1 Tax=Lactuca sativa TaxID=4236 RepID=A0A9R1V4D2_LACSA|nr:hypothetical protein LSAT_V11C700378700 [Lactuca sativa]
MLLKDTMETVGVNLQDSHIRSLELVSHLRLNKKKLLALEFDITGRLYKVVGDKYQAPQIEVIVFVAFCRKKESGRANHIDGWNKSHFKGVKGWCHLQGQQDWGKIMEDYRKMLEEVNGDDSLCALGERSGHTKGVGRKMKNIAPYYVPSTSTNDQNFNAFAQELTQQMSQQFTEQMQQMFLSQNPNAQPPQFQFNFDRIPNGHDVNEEDEVSRGYENKDDENEEGDENEESDENEEWESTSSGSDN